MLRNPSAGITSTIGKKSPLRPKSMHFLKQLLKKILFGRKTRSRRIWLGLSAGLNFQIDPANKTQRLLGLDEWEIAPFMRHFLSCSKSFVDIGSSDGFYALTALRLNPEIQIVACDSEPALEKLFKENLQINPLLPQQSITWHVAMREAPELRWTLCPPICPPLSS
jgi:hypothetical protein